MSTLRGRDQDDPGTKAPTIYTVARWAGVSHQTVSRYLRGHVLRPANKERVERALVELDYQVNDVARALASGSPRLIGALMFDLDDWAPQRLLRGAAEAAREAGFLLDMVRLDPQDQTSVDSALRLMSRPPVAGVVVLSPPDPVLQRLDLGRLKVPWVVETEPELVGDGGSPMHPVALAVEHLVSLGHRRFFHVGGPSTWLTARNRSAAFTEVVGRHDLLDCGRTQGEWGAATGYAAMADHPLDLRPTAVVAASDQLALGVLHWLAERGVRVPEDVSVTGYDGIPDAAYYAPSLTTVQVDFAALGRHTVQRLLDEHHQQERPDIAGTAARLVVRGSTAPPGEDVRLR